MKCGLHALHCVTVGGMVSSSRFFSLLCYLSFHIVIQPKLNNIGVIFRH